MFICNHMYDCVCAYVCVLNVYVYMYVYVHVYVYAWCVRVYVHRRLGLSWHHLRYADGVLSR